VGNQCAWDLKEYHFFGQLASREKPVGGHGSELRVKQGRLRGEPDPFKDGGEEGCKAPHMFRWPLTSAESDIMINNEGVKTIMGLCIWVGYFKRFLHWIPSIAAQQMDLQVHWV
jgi:hypothetical protein